MRATYHASSLFVPYRPVFRGKLIKPIQTCLHLEFFETHMTELTKCQLISTELQCFNLIFSVKKIKKNFGFFSRLKLNAYVKKTNII